MSQFNQITVSDMSTNSINFSASHPESYIRGWNDALRAVGIITQTLHVQVSLPVQQNGLSVTVSETEDLVPMEVLPPSPEAWCELPECSGLQHRKHADWADCFDGRCGRVTCRCTDGPDSYFLRECASVGYDPDESRPAVCNAYACAVGCDGQCDYQQDNSQQNDEFNDFIFGLVNQVVDNMEAAEAEALGHNARMHAQNGNIEAVELLIVALVFLGFLYYAVSELLEKRIQHEVVGLETAVSDISTAMNNVSNTGDMAVIAAQQATTVVSSAANGVAGVFDTAAWAPFGLVMSATEWICWTSCVLYAIGVVVSRVREWLSPSQKESKDKMNMLKGVLDTLTVVAVIGVATFDSKNGIKAGMHMFGQICNWIKFLYTSMSAIAFVRKFFPENALSDSFIKTDVLATSIAEALVTAEEIKVQVEAAPVDDDEKKEQMWTPEFKAKMFNGLNNGPKADQFKASQKAVEEQMRQIDLGMVRTANGTGLGITSQVQANWIMFRNFMSTNKILFLVGVVILIVTIRVALRQYETVSPVVEKGRRKSKNKRFKGVMYNGSFYSDSTMVDDIAQARQDLDDAEFDRWYSQVGRSDSAPGTEAVEKLHPKLIRVTKMLGDKVIAFDQIKVAVDKIKATPRKKIESSKVINKKATTEKRECIHGKGCTSGLPISATVNCGVKCGGHHCTHWSGCQPLAKPNENNAKTNIASLKPPCKYGDHCKDDACVSYHTVTKCKDGSQCKRIGNCFYYHSGVTKTSRGQPLFSRVAKALNTKGEAMAEMLNGKKQFNMEIASRATYPVFFKPDDDEHTSHGVYFLGCMHMTKHGLDAFTQKGLDKVYFRRPLGGFGMIPVKDFKYAAPDVVFAAIPASMRPDVKVGYRSPELSEWANLYSVAPTLVTARGAIVMIDTKTEHYRYSTATKPGDSGCGIWSDDGKLLGIHTDGSPVSNGGTCVTQRWVDLVTGKAGTSSEASLSIVPLKL
jgi:hypothetical protein